MNNPAQATSIEEGCRSFHALIQATPLQPSLFPMIFKELPSQFLGFIYGAHNAGVSTARSTYTTFDIPVVGTSTAALTLWSYYNQGYQHGLTLPLLIQNTISHPPSAPAPKLHEPEDFDGTRAKFSKFMTKLALVFSSDPTRYTTDAAKISYAASYLSCLAADWFEPHLNKATGAIRFATYEAFVQVLKNAYDDPDACATAERKLHNLKQGNKDCSAYHAEFCTYATTLNDNDMTKISFLSNGANQDLKTALSYQASLPETFDEFVQLCIKLDNRAKQLRSQSHRPAHTSPAPAPRPAPAPVPAPGTTSGTAPSPMDLS